MLPLKEETGIDPLTPRITDSHYHLGVKTDCQSRISKIKIPERWPTNRSREERTKLIRRLWDHRERVRCFQARKFVAECCVLEFVVAIVLVRLDVNTPPLYDDRFDIFLEESHDSNCLGWRTVEWFWGIASSL